MSQTGRQSYQHQQGALCHHGRRPGLAPVPAHEGPRQAGGAARRQIPHRGHSDLELHQLPLPPHLYFDAVQFHLAAQPHFADLQVRPVRLGFVEILAAQPTL